MLALRDSFKDKNWERFDSLLEAREQGLENNIDETIRDMEESSGD